MKILIIDDDYDGAVTLKALLMSQEGYEIDVTYNGKLGLEMMKANPNYDLLILDVMMPEFSGVDVCKAMSQDEKLKKIPVLLASALPINSNELEELLDQFKSLVVVKGSIEKPFVVESILAEIKKIV